MLTQISYFRQLVITSWEDQFQRLVDKRRKMNIIKINEHKKHCV